MRGTVNDPNSGAISPLIAANKVDGVRCANPSYVEDAKLSRIDNNANAISLKSK